jgi:dUTP pyrophosphatase
MIIEGVPTTDVIYEPMLLKVKLLSENAKLPTRGSEFAEGLDLYSPIDEVIPGRGYKLIKLDIAVQPPREYYTRIAPRSGYGAKGILCHPGTIDWDFRGCLAVLLYNFTDTNFVITKHDRIAQLIVEKSHIIPVVECNELSDTTRGSGGFGSTGK